MGLELTGVLACRAHGLHSRTCTITSEIPRRDLLSSAAVAIHRPLANFLWFTGHQTWPQGLLSRKKK